MLRILCLGFVACGFLVWCLRLSVSWVLIVLIFFVCFTCVLVVFVGCVVGFAACLRLLFRFGLGCLLPWVYLLLGWALAGVWVGWLACVWLVCFRFAVAWIVCFVRCWFWFAVAGLFWLFG